MLLPIKPICPVNKIRRDGTCPIFLQYCFNAKKRTLLNSGIAIPPLFWSSRKQLITGLKLNTIGKTIKHLKGFVKDRVKRKIIPPIDLSDFKIPEEEIDAIYLSHEEIASIYSFDLTNYPHLTAYRDLLVLTCLTGLRFSD